MGSVLSKLTLSRMRQTRHRGIVMRKVADKIGLVSFGAVDHRDDDHDIIMGLTLSTTHKDKHFAVGSYDGYDISMVDRYDVMKYAGKPPEPHQWCIIRVSLRHHQPIPHTFLMPVSDHMHFYERLFVALRHMQPANDILEKAHQNEFLRRFTIYAAAHHTQDIEHHLDHQVTAGIAARFWPHAIEIRDNTLYVYLTEHRLTETVLGSAVEAALWLAETLDNETS